jgi:hypothetical protein
MCIGGSTLEKETLSSTQTARLLNLRIDYTLMLVRSGIISATKQDGQWVIDRASAEAYRKRQNFRRSRSEQLEQRRERRASRTEETATASA